MRCIGRQVHETPSQRVSPIEKLVGWRTVMERELPYGNLMSFMHAFNAVGTYRDRLAPQEWFWCPSCGGRGLWVDREGRNRYCGRCGGTKILLVCEQDSPKSEEAVPTGWRSWLRRPGLFDLWKKAIVRRHP